MKYTKVPARHLLSTLPLTAFILTVWMQPWAYAASETGSQLALSLGECSQTLLSDEIVFPNRRSGFGMRGFLPTRIPLSAEAGSKGSAQGIMYWGLRIYLVKSLEEARRHDEKIPNPLMKGSYLILPQYADKLNSLGVLRLTPLDKDRIYRTMRNRKADFVWFDTEGVAQRPSQEVLRALAPRSWETLPPNSDSVGKSMMIQSGWFFPKVRGVLRHSETFQGGTFKNLRKEFARNLRAKVEGGRQEHLTWPGYQQSKGWGMKVTFNQDLDKALDLIAKQRRKGQSSVSNRFSEDLIHEVRQRYARGEVVSVEVWDADGDLVAGTFAYKVGSVYSPDTVYYDNDKYPNTAINFAKMAIVALMDRLAEYGITWVDAGMVTPFTRGLRGQYVPQETFLSMFDSLAQKEVVVDWSRPYTPTEMSPR